MTEIGDLGPFYISAGFVLLILLYWLIDKIRSKS